MQKRMFKVICPVPKKDKKEKYWMRVGSAFINKDESINVYLDAIPVWSNDNPLMIQLREMTEEDFKRSSERRAVYAAPDTHSTTSAAADGVPF